MPFLDEFKADARSAWLRIVGWANKLLASIFGAISAAYATYPDSVKSFLHKVPEWAVFPAAVAVFLFINHAIKRAKNAS